MAYYPGKQWTKRDLILILGDPQQIAGAQICELSGGMKENITLTRQIKTRLGWKGFTIYDVIENHGFEPQPLMMLYHFNFGFPLLGPGAEVVGPILDT